MLSNVSEYWMPWDFGVETRNQFDFISYSPLLLIRWRCAYNIKFFFLQQAKIEGVYNFSHVAQLNRRKDNNICQSIWDKSEVLWKTCWGTHQEPDGNPLGTWREHSGNTFRTREKWKKKILPWIPSPPIFKGKKSKAPWVHAWTFPLAAWNFSSQMSLSPFLAWANNIPCKEHPTYRLHLV